MRDAMLSVDSPSVARAGAPGPRDRRTLTPADWTAAALDALARDGLRAVAVEPLAERLGATKGSFYWHFRDRNALLEAAVGQWERTGTDEVLERFDTIADDRERHGSAVGWVAESDRDIRIFLALLWHADHPVIGPAVRRILEKRLAYALRLREAAGEDPAEARQATMHAYCVLLGLHLLRRAAPGIVAEGGASEALPEYVTSLVRQAVGAEG